MFPAEIPDDGARPEADCGPIMTVAADLVELFTVPCRS